MKVLPLFLMLTGSIVIFLGALGLYRMPDLYNRMQTSAKASSLGAALVLLAVGVHFADVGVTARVIATILFIFLTVPVGAHLLARAAHRTGVPTWSETKFDELRTARESGQNPADDTQGENSE